MTFRLTKLLQLGCIEFGIFIYVVEIVSFSSFPLLHSNQFYFQFYDPKTFPIILKFAQYFPILLLLHFNNLYSVFCTQVAQLERTLANEKIEKCKIRSDGSAFSSKDSTRTQCTENVPHPSKNGEHSFSVSSFGSNASFHNLGHSSVGNLRSRSCSDVAVNEVSVESVALLNGTNNKSHNINNNNNSNSNNNNSIVFNQSNSSSTATLHSSAATLNSHNNSNSDSNNNSHSSSTSSLLTFTASTTNSSNSFTNSQNKRNFSCSNSTNVENGTYNSTYSNKSIHKNNNNNNNESQIYGISSGLVKYNSTNSNYTNSITSPVTNTTLENSHSHSNVNVNNNTMNTNTKSIMKISRHPRPKSERIIQPTLPITAGLHLSLPLSWERSRSQSHEAVTLTLSNPSLNAPNLAGRCRNFPARPPNLHIDSEVFSSTSIFRFIFVFCGHFFVSRLCTSQMFFFVCLFCWIILLKSLRTSF